MDKTYDFIKGEILIIDKPLEWTSFDVVHKIRNAIKRKLEIKKIKVGHAGTLDPLATGVLVVCTGKMTKQIDYFINESKSYDGVIQLGATTPSYDLESEIDVRFPVDVNSKQLEAIRLSFLGDQLQEPPIFSAKKINGKRAYEYARKGEKIELKKNAISILDLDLDLVKNDQLKFKIDCSKGTYIRALARDISLGLKTGGYLIELRRIKSGDFDLSHALSVEEWVDIIDSQ